MRLVVTFAAAAIYIVAPLYLLLGTLGFGLRIGGNLYAEAGFGPLRAIYLAPLMLLACGGSYLLRWLMRRSV